jgi:hypothetical protein
MTVPFEPRLVGGPDSIQASMTDQAVLEWRAKGEVERVAMFLAAKW